MALIQPNLKDVTEFAAIEPGTYQSKILEVSVETSKSGNAMIVVKHAISVDGTERTRKGYHVIHGQGAFQFDQLLRACGFDDMANSYKEDPQNAPPFDTDNIVGCEVNISIESDVYNGQKTDKIAGYLRI